MSLLRNPLLHLAATLLAIGGSTLYLRSHLVQNLEENEARADEIEDTLRGHIGYIEEALDRMEGKATEADRGKKTSEYYSKRARDEKKAEQ
ncbi:hypothetical protein LTR37_006011 [Vermiconidia calcicola]|uniref:Uncharacterized protein n=1 Tax=Vermiconidia calcicola TaxID=1690605 RepID=A0ACC3NIJ7_9PEZI|nr:hypothetical protein LTR37_006011 [Vermiconidia calcicola]